MAKEMRPREMRPREMRPKEMSVPKEMSMSKEMKMSGPNGGGHLYMQTNEIQKWTRPQKSFSLRPVAFGNQ